MKRTLIFIYFFIFLFTSLSLGQIGFSPKIDSLINLITNQSVALVVRQLSGDTVTIIGGSPYTIVSRHYANASNPKAAQYILEKFQSFGLTARYQNNGGSYGNINVIAYKPGIKFPNQYFVICGHYDDMPSGSTAPGADDNASGTVAVLEAARILSTFNLDYSVIFVAFDEEERGLYGSKAFVDTAYFKGDSIVCALNFDMIAYDGNNDGKCWVVTNNPSDGYASDFISAILTYVSQLQPEKHIDLTANSDHASFWTRNYLAFMMIEDENDFNPYYHTVNDNFSNINVTFFRNSVRAAIAALTAFANNYKMNFVHTPLPSGPYTSARTATVVINSKNKIAGGSNAPRLYYKINNGSFIPLNPSYTNLDTFKFTIPGQPLGTTVSYYFAAQDSAARFVCTYPAGGKGINPPGTIPPSQVFSYQVSNITYACIGTGTASSNYPFTTYWMDGRTDMLFTASEISGAGGNTSQAITQIGFNVISASSQPMNGFKVKLQNTNLSSLSGFVSTGWTICYDGTYTVPGTGWQYITLTTPFYWDGVNNLLIEICYNNSSYTQYSPVYATSNPNKTWGQYSDLSSGDGCTQLTAGTVQTNRPNVCLIFNQVSNIANNTNTPVSYALSQNYPNPFNPITKIEFAIPKAEFVTLKVYDILGKEVKTLVSEFKQPGYYTIDFNASDLSSGIYYYRIEAGTFVSVRKMILIK